MRRPALIPLLALSALLAGEVPYGHRDFVPTPERPVGFRADGSGAWPGATPVSSWDSATGKNIVWKTPLPGPSYSTPIVVGRRVYAMSDPQILTCVDAGDGRILWSTAIDHTTAMDSGLAARVREHNAFFLELNGIYFDWRQAVDALEKEVAAAGGDAKSVVWSFGSHKLFIPDPDALPAGCPPLTDPAQQAELRRLHAAQKQHGFRIKRSDNSSMIDLLDAKRSPHGARYRELSQEADTWWFGHWTFLCSESMASPCSDGRRVYALTSNDTVAAYDLEGKQQWLTWDHPPGKVNKVDWLSCRFIGSLVLRHGVLACHANGEMKAFDAASGRKLWGDLGPELSDGDAGKKIHNSWGLVNTPGFLDVPLPDGGVLHVVHLDKKFYRLEDGKVLGTVEVGLKEGDRPNAHGGTYQGDLLLLRRKLYRIKASSRDQVAAELLWTFSGPRGSERETSAAIIHDGKVLGAFSADLVSGTGLPIPVCGDKWGAPQAAGRFLYPGLLAGDGRMVDWQAGKGIGAGGKLIDDRFATDPAFARRWYYHYMSGKPSGFANPTFQGNRIFYRTNGYLWCLGDPQQAYDGREAP
jgi:outer membrane protein assembly factor BamB